jgi:cold shock CspA family protein
MTENNTQPQKAICSWWNRLKGWSFLVELAPSGDALNQGDIFCHCSAITAPSNHKYLVQGTIVSFEMGERNGKPQAKNVQVIRESGGTAKDVLSGAAARR